MQALHARMQPLLLFFIDGANLIEPKEPEWDLLLAIRTKGDVVTVVGSQPFRRTAPSPMFCSSKYLHTDSERHCWPHLS